MDSLETIFESVFDEEPPDPSVSDLAGIVSAIAAPRVAVGFILYHGQGRVLLRHGQVSDDLETKVGATASSRSVATIELRSPRGATGTFVLFLRRDDTDEGKLTDDQRRLFHGFAAHCLDSLTQREELADLGSRLKLAEREREVLQKEHRRVVALNLAEREARLNEHRAYQIRLEEEVNFRTHQLRERNQELERARSEIEQHLETVRIQKGECEIAMRRAEEANASKTSFLANMSHEVRTPLTAILGFADMLVEQITSQNASPSDIVEPLLTIKRNGEHLLEVINDILDISKIESGKMDLERRPCDTRSLVEETVDSFRERARQRGLLLKLRTVEPVPDQIVTDPVRFKQILINLIGNALKFTEAGYVEICYGLTDLNLGPPKLQIKVVDTGAGIEADKFEKIFEPFAQAESSTNRRYGGTGLGLTISRRLARLLGGDVEVESEFGKGSTFTVKVALAEGDANRSSEGSVESLSPEEFRNRIGKRDWSVLLAEDSPDNQRLISFHLKACGATVQIAPNGLEAINAVNEAASAGSAYDLILMDMQMPIMDGYEATRRLRRQGYEGAVIALTAHAMSGDRARCLDAGCDDYATKPVRRNQLLGQIARFIAAKKSTGN